MTKNGLENFFRGKNTEIRVLTQISFSVLGVASNPGWVGYHVSTVDRLFTSLYDSLDCLCKQAEKCRSKFGWES